MVIFINVCVNPLNILKKIKVLKMVKLLLYVKVLVTVLFQLFQHENVAISFKNFSLLLDDP